MGIYRGEVLLSKPLGGQRLVAVSARRSRRDAGVEDGGQLGGLVTVGVTDTELGATEDRPYSSQLDCDASFLCGLSDSLCR